MSFDVEFDPSKRLAEPENVCDVRRVEIEFAIPVELTAAQNRTLWALVDEITEAARNQPVDGVHWTSGGGSKPVWSQADRAFLGMAPDGTAPESGEPEFDDTTLQITTTARAFVSNKERTLVERARRERGLLK